MNGYCIVYDENGRAYIEHGIIRNAGQTAHKYIMKIGDGVKARYFYTQEQIDAYKKNLQDRKTDRYARDVIKQREKQGREYQKKQEKAQKEAQYEEVSLKDFLTGGSVGRELREREKKAKEAQKAAEKAEKKQIREQEKAEKYQQRVNELVANTRENSKNQKQADFWKDNPDAGGNSDVLKYHREKAEQYGDEHPMLRNYHENQAKALEREIAEYAASSQKSYQDKANKEVERVLNQSHSYRKANEHMEKAAEQAEIAREQRRIAREYERLAEELIDDYERTSLPGMAQKTVREGAEVLSKLLNGLTDIPMKALNSATVRVKK